MNRKLYNILLGLFGTAVWLFFALAYQGHLHFTEGNQIFLFTGSFAKETILDRGGLANYLAAFLTQFYYYSFLGGFVIALTCVLTALGISRFSRSESVLPLSMVIPGLYAVMMLDGNWVLVGLVGICCAVWIAVLVSKLPFIPRLVVAVLIACPVWHFLLRAKFFEYMVAPDAAYACIVAGTALVCVASHYIRLERQKAVEVILYVIVFAGMSFGAYERFDKLDEEIHRYEYMVRVRDWDGILEYAEGRKPSSPVSTNAINLALEMKGRLADEMFLHYQNGLRSLVNFEERKISSEVLFLTGFVNEALHVAFEDMAGNPNRSRGVCHLTRLAEYGAVGNRSKALNAKYLEILDKTLFYRNFKPDTSLVSPDMEPSDDFFFNPEDFGSMLKTLACQRPGNQRVRDYYAASLLLQKDLLSFGEQFADTDPMPRHYKEAMGLVKVYKGEAPDTNLAQYIQAYDAARGNESRLRRFSGTYWYYANFR
ncbi:MAG: hypothetical protein KBT00_05660 [Bacteroidales bacterium]|nr:hypothetical protein [Candidatus Cacconaster merdequi]